MIKTVIFHRSYDRYSGGHQKMLDYFGHMDAHPAWRPSIYFSSGSHLALESGWAEYKQSIAVSYIPGEFDLVFLAGVDWQAYLPVRPATERPVLNLIQHVRHGDPASNVHPFLRERAIRICVSPEVETAILDTGLVNGPVFTIPNGIDLDLLGKYAGLARTRDVYILGNKQPRLAQELGAVLSARGFRVLVHREHTERLDVLMSMATSRISVLLPHATEGFYLPALEAMALSELVIVPDCVGNRSFCIDGTNCLMPSPDPDDLAQAVESAFAAISSGKAVAIQRSAQNTVACHGLGRERAAFYEILDNLDQIW